MSAGKKKGINQDTWESLHKDHGAAAQEAISHHDTRRKESGRRSRYICTLSVITRVNKRKVRERGTGTQRPLNVLLDVLLAKRNGEVSVSDAFCIRACDDAE